MDNKRQELESLNNEDLLWAANSEKSRVAYEVAYKRFAPLVFAVCLRYLQVNDAKHVASELMQNVLSLADARKVQNVEAFLRQSSKNRSITFLTQLGRFNRKKDNLVAEIISLKNVEFTQIDSLTNEEDIDKRKLYKALELLRPDQRECITLFFFENLTYQKIDELTGFGLKAVKSHIQNGKLRLRNLLLHGNL